MKRITFSIFLLSVWGVLFAQQPDISVNMDTISDVLPNGAMSVQAFTIKNNGDTTLHWNIVFIDSLSNGPVVSFVKEDNTNWTLPVNQDRITNTVWITRDLTKSIFNAKSEAASTNISPEGTLWCLGSANETVPGGEFTDFITAHGGDPQSLIGDTITLFLDDDEIFYEVAFTSYSGGGIGGGFAYTRRQMMPWFSVSEIGDSLLKGESIVIEVAFTASYLASGYHYGGLLINSNDPDTPRDTVVTELEILPPGEINVLESEVVDTLVSGASATFDLNIENKGYTGLIWNANNPVTITKDNYANWMLEENQDRITADIWITRQNREGLFNIAQEPSYDRNSWESPVGTQWAYGKTADVSPSDYTTWRQSFRNHIPTYNLPGRTLSLKIVDEDIYFDILFNQWTSGGNGGGFSYTRTTPFPKWLSGDMGGTVPGQDTSTVTFILYADGLDAGTYSYDLEIRSNDAGLPPIVVPVTLTVLGTPELSTDSEFNYGDVFVGVSKTYKLPIENTGTDVLTITSITTDSAEFVPGKTSLTVPPGEQTTVSVIFTPVSLGYISDTIRITSNDTVTPLTKVFVEGTGIDVPGISLSAYSFRDTLMLDSISTDTITMTNTGETELVWRISSSGALVYDKSGFLFSFTKKPGANTDLAENRDPVTENISLTGNEGGLYDYNGSDIEYAMGSTYEALNLNIEYDNDWREAMDNEAANLPGKTISLHLIDYDLYLDIHILSWGSRMASNGYSYTRSAPMPYWLAAEAEFSGSEGVLSPGSSERIIITHNALGITVGGVYNGSVILHTNVPDQPEVVIANSLSIAGTNPVISIDNTILSATLISEGETTRKFTVTNEGTGHLFWQLGEPTDSMERASEKVVFYKFNDADWTKEENQDRITDRVWLTRADEQGLFNIARESSYDRNDHSSPVGTEWAYGYTLELSPDDYDTWYNTHDRNPPEMVGKPMSMHLIEEDIYFDIVFTGWQMDGRGGGFSYIRSEPHLPSTWIYATPVNGTILPGESQTVTVTFKASDQLAGLYTAEMLLSSNDKSYSEDVIQLSLEVLGNPEIQLPESQITFGDAFIGYVSNKELTVRNVGNDVLHISDIVFDDPAFSVDDTELEIPPFDEINLVVSLTPVAEQSYTGTMTLSTDDPAHASVDVSLSGTGVVAPDLAVNVSELSQVLFTGEVATQKLIITNSGMGILDWYLGPQVLEVTFSKKSGDNYRLAEYQDRINENVWITRANREGLFNIAQEASYDRGNWESPLGTEWAYGATADVDPPDYTTWRDAVRNRANINTYQLPGKTFSLKLTETKEYFDIEFLVWQQGGGGCAYIRKFVKGTMSRSWVDFSIESGSLGAGQSDTILVTFNPNANISAGNLYLDLTISSNDPDGSSNVAVSLVIDDIVAVNPIADTVVQEGFTSYTKDISDIFQSKNNDDLVYLVASSNEMVATVELTDTILTVTEAGKGITDISISAWSESGESGSQTFTLRVNDIPDLTQVQDVRYPDGFISADMDLSGAFTDSDADVLSITAASSDESVVTVSVAGEILTISEVTSGISTITLTADDGFGGMADNNFMVRVNSAPIVANPISDVVVEEFFVTSTIDVSEVFTDPDMDPIILATSSSDETVALSFVKGTDLILVEGGVLGNSTITLTASDEITMNPANTTFTITVNQSTVGLESRTEGEFTLYPNPSDGHVTLALQDIYQGELMVTVLDMNGRKVFVNNFNVNDDEVNLDFTTLEKGMYILQIGSDDVIQHTRFIIE